MWPPHDDCGTVTCKKRHALLKTASYDSEVTVMWCSVLQRVAVCCSVLQCVAVCCGVLKEALEFNTLTRTQTSSRRTTEWVLSSAITRMKESWNTYINEPCHAYGWLLSCICKSRATIISRTWMYEWDMSHILMVHVTNTSTNEVCLSCLTRKWVISHIWMSAVMHMHESCHAYECLTSQVWMSHTSVTLNVSRHVCDMTHATHITRA